MYLNSTQMHTRTAKDIDTVIVVLNNQHLFKLTPTSTVSSHSSCPPASPSFQLGSWSSAWKTPQRLAFTGHLLSLKSLSVDLKKTFTLPSFSMEFWLCIEFKDDRCFLSATVLCFSFCLLRSRLLVEWLFLEVMCLFCLSVCI